MMKRFLLTVFVLGLCSATGAEAAKGVLRETFANKKRDWTFDEYAGQSGSIANGVLRLENDNQENRWLNAGLTPDLDWSRDFAISVEARFLKGGQTSEFGMDVATSGDWRSYEAMLSRGDGGTYVASRIEGEWVLHQPTLQIQDYVHGDTLKLVYKRIGNRVFCFVNDQVFSTYPMDRLRGDRIFLCAQAGATVEFDNLTIEYLEEPPERVAGYFKTYAAFKRERGLDPLGEEFDDNRRKWVPEGGADTWIGVYQDGALLVENLDLRQNLTMRRYQMIHVDPLRDFEVEARVRYVEGRDDRLVGAFWGGDDASGGTTRIGLSGNGHYVVDGHDGSSWSAILPWKKSPLVETDGWNTLIARRIGDELFYFVNGAIVGSSKSPRRSIDRVGLDVATGAVAEFDRIALRYIDQPAEALEAEVARYREDLRARRLAEAGALEPFVEEFEEDSGEWLWMESNESQTVELREGRLYWESHHPEGWALVIKRQHPGVNQVADYRVSLRVRNQGAVEDQEVSLKWGGDNSKWYGLGIAFNGHYRFHSGDEKQEIDWTGASAVNRNGWNELAVRKIDESLYLLINDELVAVRRAAEPLGSDLAILVGNGMEVEIDRVTLSYPQLSVNEKEAEKSGYREYMVEHRLKYRRDGEWREDPMQIRWRLEAEFEADKKIQRAFDRLRKRYRNKTLAHIIADKGQPYYINRPFHYFYLGNVGQMGWYIEVSATRSGGADNDPRNYSVQSVNAASSYELKQRYGL